MSKPLALNEKCGWNGCCDVRIAWPLRWFAKPVGSPTGVRISHVAPSIEEVVEVFLKLFGIQISAGSSSLSLELDSLMLEFVNEHWNEEEVYHHQGSAYNRSLLESSRVDVVNQATIPGGWADAR